MICSMSRKGNCWENGFQYRLTFSLCRNYNAPTESWFSFKNERVHRLRFETRDEMTAMSFEYIEVLYNRKRQHSTLGYKSPMQFPEDWFIAQQQVKLVA